MFHLNPQAMFREKIKGTMYDKGLTVKELAKRTCISTSTISSFLVGNRAISNENLEVILKTLDLTLVPKANFVYVADEPKNEEVAEAVGTE